MMQMRRHAIFKVKQHEIQFIDKGIRNSYSVLYCCGITSTGAKVA